MDSVTELANLNTETQTIATPPPLVPPPPAPPTSKERVASTIAGSVVTLTRGAAAIGTFDLATLPAPVGAAIAVMGLRDYLIRADDPVAAFAGLVAGTVPGRKVAAAKELDPWRLAWAHATAEAEVRKGGGKPYIGKNPTEDFKLALDNAIQRAPGLDKDTLKAARTKSAVVAHWERITGAPVDLI